MKRWKEKEQRKWKGNCPDPTAILHWKKNLNAALSEHFWLYPEDIRPTDNTQTGQRSRMMRQYDLHIP